jgi:hypothetical protein
MEQRRKSGHTPAKLRREVFTTSRLLEFCSEHELVKQTGHPVDEWALVITKELLDNAIDAAEEAGAAPVISVEVQKGKIVVTDDGAGITAEVVENILNNVRVSSREAYVSPTRGAQGNALKTIIAMPFALNHAEAETLIESKGVSHHIRFKVDHVRQEPAIEYHHAGPNVKKRRADHDADAAFSFDGWRPRYQSVGSGDRAPGPRRLTARQRGPALNVDVARHEGELAKWPDLVGTNLSRPGLFPFVAVRRERWQVEVIQ